MYLGSIPGRASINAQVVKSVDTRDLKSLGCKAVRVQVPPWAPSLLDKEFGAKKSIVNGIEK